jgi:hypothetical protein
MWVSGQKQLPDSSWQTEMQGLQMRKNYVSFGLFLKLDPLK